MRSSIARSILMILLVSLATILFVPFRSQLVHAQAGGVCGQFVQEGDWPVFRPHGSSQSWLIDPYIYGIFRQGQSARIWETQFGPDAGNMKYLVGYSDIRYVASCEPNISFWVDNATLTAGECTTLRWSIDNIEAVYLDGDGVAGQDARTVCPTASTTYYLRVITYIGETSRTQTVNVVAPPPPPTPTTVPLVDNARFVADVTIPDGTIFNPNAKFTKTWRVQNSGTTSWDTGYQLAFLSGDRMSNPATMTLTRSVNPGEQIDLSVPLSAPANPGTYRGIFQMRNVAGAFFGNKLTVVIKVLAPTPTRTPIAKGSPTVTPTPTPRTFTVTWMEIAPQVPMQNQAAVVRVFLDNAGPRDANYLSGFDGEVILRNSAGQVVERQVFDHDHNASFLPDAEAMKKDPFSRKWVLTVRQVRFRQWSDTATLEIWLRPLGTRGGMNSVNASMRLAVKADPDALTRCVSFVSKKLSSWPIGDVKWVLVATGASTRIGTCTTRECVALEIAQLVVKLSKEQAMQLLSVALQVANLQGMTGAADCYNLFAP